MVATIGSVIGKWKERAKIVLIYVKINPNDTLRRTRQEEQRKRDFNNVTNSSECMDVQVMERMLKNTAYAQYRQPYLQTDFGIYVYTAFIVGSITMSIAKNLMFYKICMNASRRLHDTMFARLLRAPMRFFDVNPSGKFFDLGLIIHSGKYS